jgi:EAL domain-containing protein (putative c-di-GMP-specific phosphodiesterase class I)/methylmalonyl-CoA mutase cobalamin-binding subunit
LNIGHEETEEVIVSVIKPTVLLVENHGFQRAIAAQMLSQLGCECVYQAHTSEQAVQLLREHQPIDVLVCNVDILGVDALQIIEEAVTRKRVRAVLIGGGLAPEVRTGLYQWVSMLGLEYLIDAGNPLDFDKLQRFFEALSRPRDALVPAPTPVRIRRGEVQKGIVDGQFSTCFLPRCTVADGRIRSADAQLHWQHPRHGLLAMQQFCPAVERAGLGNALLLHMAEQALEVQRRLARADLQVGLSIGMRLEQLGHRPLMNELLRMLREHLTGKHRVALELSHVGLARPKAEYLETLLRARLMGCDLGMQGFGFGGASLQRLCQWPINQLRLASPFLLEAPDQSRHLAVVQHMSVAARTLGIELTVTGVQSAVHHLLLFDLGCLRGQGDYFAAPLTADALHERLKQPQVLAPMRPL